MAEWWRGATIYQIYPRSFLDSDGDGVGDLAGVTAKLDHVAALGVDAIWLSPFYRSPMKDFGYDVSDYRDVDPLFGDLAAFDKLLARAHDLGLKVVIDQVWAHTSDRHPWFLESLAAREGSKADWYVWADARPDGSPPNNWLAAFGGPSWTWNARRRQYYFHNFLPEQPDLNYWNPEVQAAILDVARFWLDRGVDGFRLDVINYLFHDADLRDNPPAAGAASATAPTDMQRHVFDRTRPQTLDFIARLRALMDSYGGRMAVGEVYDEAPLAVQQTYAGAGRLHTAYSFYLLNAHAATPRLFVNAMRAWAGADGWPSWSLGNHDVTRFPTRLARGNPDLTRTLIAVLLAMPGTIFLYQGDELGLPDAKVPYDRLRDPFAIAAYDGGAGRDGARTPMPWRAAAPMAGFTSAADAWLPLDPVHVVLAADRQAVDPNSTLSFTRRMVAMRKSQPALRLGSAEILEAPDGVLAFERRLDGERLLCLFELAGRQARLNHPDVRTATVLALWQGAGVEGGSADLPPYSGAILRVGL